MLVGLGLITLAASASISCAADDPGIGRSYQVPYRLTETNHFLVRLRINGKGPFNFLVDTGAPAFFISTETAKKVGLEPARDSFWTRVERVDFEGGATLLGMRARIEDPFQLVGMNALGLPGASIDGLIGYTVLARFRIELDPTKDRMTWTRLDFNPVDPPVPHRRNPGDAPAEMQAMNALGPLAKGLAFLMGKQAEEQLHPRGFLGLEWSELKEQIGATGKTATTSPIQINRVLPGSPAARAGVQPGDRLIRLKGKEIQDRKAILTDLAQIHPGDPVRLTIRRGEGPQARELDLTVTAGEGF
ncbi:MAG: signal protein PDZ [Planctomycetes bacterium SCN 63-9]|nr:MAG: signal protein PDZ [Planctomycetes bacterium SCN 63-9]